MEIVNVQLESVVVSMDGVVKQKIIVYHLKVVNLNLVNAQRKRLLLPLLLLKLLPPLLLKLLPLLLRLLLQQLLKVDVERIMVIVNV